jgi:hypothetical protein
MVPVIYASAVFFGLPALIKAVLVIFPSKTG